MDNTKASTRGGRARGKLTGRPTLTTDRPDSPEDAVVEEDEGGHGAEAGGQEARPVDVVTDVVGVVAQVSHLVVHLQRKITFVGDPP